MVSHFILTDCQAKAKTVTAHRPDALLEHAHLLHGLIASIVGREDLAEDILQDVWVAALTTPPSQSWDPRRWLNGVARNLTRQFRRESSRRSRRERIAARPEGLPSPDETVARLESLRTVVDAVETLDEPYREVVMLRFFDAMPVREIASRLAVPAETIRTRIRRALEKLRGKLDATHGERGSWSTCLLPFVFIPATPTPPVATTLVGVASKLAGAGAALAGVVFGFIYLVPDDEEPSPADPDRLAASSSIVERGTLATTSPPIDHRSLITIGDRLRIHGRVTRTGNQPYSSARVRIRQWSGFAEAGRPAVEARLVANEQGRFEWVGPRPAVPTRFIIDCGLPNRELRGKHELQWTPGDPDPEVFRLHCYQLDCEVAGTVVDDEGRAIAGATIGVFWRQAKTGAKGRYRIRAASELQSQTVRVFARGYVNAKRVLRMRLGAQHRIDWQLRPGVSISGRVTTVDGTPITKARFDRYWTTEHQEGLTDADGRYELTGIDPEKVAYLHLRHDAYVPARAVVKHQGRSVTHDIVMRRGATLSGMVTDDRGQPVVAATIRLYSESLDSSALQEILSRTGGRFLIKAVAPGKKLLITTRRGMGPARTAITIIGSKPNADLRITLPRALAITGTVVDATGSPVRGVRVTTTWGQNRHRSPYLETRAHSDAKGRFHLEDLPKDVVSLTATGRGWMRTEISSMASAGNELTITMRRAGGLAGKVIDATTGEPIPEFRVRFVTPELQAGEREGMGYNANWSSQGYTFTDLEGTWDTGRATLEVGAVLGLEFHAEGYATKIVPRAIVESDPVAGDSVVALDAGQALRGRVLAAATNRPIANAKVRVLTANESSHSSAAEVETGFLAVTDAEGKFAFKRLPAGELRLWITHVDWPEQLEGPFVSRAPRTIRILSGGTVTGSVLAGTATPGAGAELSLDPEDRLSDALPRRTRSDKHGHFRFLNVPAGIYILVWWEYRGSSGVSRRSYRVVVTRGEVADVEMEPRPAGARVLGGLQGNAPLPTNCYVSLSSRTSLEVDPALQVQRLPGWMAFVKNGRFEIFGVPAGKYLLHVSQLGSERRASGAKEIEVQPGRPLEVNLKVQVTGKRGR